MARVSYWSCVKHYSWNDEGWGITKLGLLPRLFLIAFLLCWVIVFLYLPQHVPELRNQISPSVAFGITMFYLPLASPIIVLPILLIAWLDYRKKNSDAERAGWQ